MQIPQYSLDPQSIFKSEFIYNPFPILASLRKNSPISSIEILDFTSLVLLNLLKVLGGRQIFS